MRIRVSAAAQARSTSNLLADPACWKMYSGSDACEPWNGLVLMNCVAEDGQQQRRGLADDAGDRQHDAGGDAGAGGREHDRQDGFHFGMPRRTQPRAASWAPA